MTLDCEWTSALDTYAFVVPARTTSSNEGYIFLGESPLPWETRDDLFARTGKHLNWWLNKARIQARRQKENAVAIYKHFVEIRQ